VVLAGINWLGIWKSDNGGQSWQKFNEGLPDSNSVLKIVKQTNTGKIYIVATKADDGWIYERQSISGSWKKIGIDTLRQSYYYSDLKITSTNDLYLGTKGIFKIRLL
jgi:hypothetical protein